MLDETQHNRGSLPEQLQDLWERRRWLMIVAFLLVFPPGVSLVLALPPLYRSETTLLLGQGDISESVISTPASDDLGERLDVIDKAILSRQRLLQLVDRYRLYPELVAQAPAEVVVERLRKDIGREREATGQEWNQNPVYTLRLSYQNRDPELAAAVANELASSYRRENEKLRERRISSTRTFLSAELAQVREQLAAQEEKIRDFKNAHLGELPEQQAMNLATLERLNSEVRLNGEKQLQLLNRRDAVLEALGVTVPGGGGLSRLDSLRAQLVELRRQYTDKYPEIVRLKEEISALEASEAQRETPVEQAAPASRRELELRALEAEIEGLAAQQEGMRESISRLQDRIESTPRVEQELRSLNADYDTIREQYLALQKRYQDALLAESLEQEQNQQFQIIEPALAASFPVAPQRLRLIVMGFVLSLGFAGGVVMLREQLDSSFHTLRELRGFTRLPVLASVARIHTTAEKAKQALYTLCMAACVVFCVGLLVVLAREYGARAEGLVWLLAGRGL